MLLHLAIITPDRTVFEGDVDSVSLPTPDGEITILPHHIPLLSILVAGSILVRQNVDEYLFAVSRGAIEVDGQSIRILAETADRAADLEEEAIERAKEEAQRLMSDKQGDTEGFAQASAMLERELARLKVVRKHRTKKMN